MKEKKANPQSKETLLEEIPRIVTAARTGDYPETARRINIFLQQLQKELSKGYIPAEGIAKITYSLETLLAMQQMSDWIAFADVLEYEFVPLWRSCAAAKKTD